MYLQIVTICLILMTRIQPELNFGTCQIRFFSISSICLLDHVAETCAKACYVNIARLQCKLIGFIWVCVWSGRLCYLVMVHHRSLKAHYLLLFASPILAISSAMSWLIKWTLLPACLPACWCAFVYLVAVWFNVTASTSLFITHLTVTNYVSNHNHIRDGMTNIATITATIADCLVWCKSDQVRLQRDTNRSFACSN